MGCYNSWANLRSSSCSPLGEKSLWNGTIKWAAFEWFVCDSALTGTAVLHCFIHWTTVIPLLPTNQPLPTKVDHSWPWPMGNHGWLRGCTVYCKKIFCMYIEITRPRPCFELFQQFQCKLLFKSNAIYDLLSPNSSGWVLSFHWVSGNDHQSFGLSGLCNFDHSKNQKILFLAWIYHNQYNWYFTYIYIILSYMSI